MDRIVLPQKFACVNDEIQHRRVSRFLLTLDQKKIAEAAAKGYTELEINLVTHRFFIREERYWVIAKKPGETSDTDFIKIKEIPGAGYSNIPVAMSIRQAKQEYLYIRSRKKEGCFYPSHTIRKAEQAEHGMLDRLVDKRDGVMSCPTGWLPYSIILKDMRLRKVRDYKWEDLEKEGMKRYTVTQEEFDEDPSYGEKHTNAAREYFCLDWNVKNYNLNYDTDKDTLYRRFIRSVYGQKVWDNNETVVELTVYPGLNDRFYSDTNEFLKFCEALLPEEEIDMYRKRFKDPEDD